MDRHRCVSFGFASSQPALHTQYSGKDTLPFALMLFLAVIVANHAAINAVIMWEAWYSTSWRLTGAGENEWADADAIFNRTRVRLKM